MEETVDITTSWHSYPKSLAVGHRYLANLFEDEVVVTEKVDGSQFSFGVFDGMVKCRSKGKQIVMEAPDKMFIKAVDHIKKIAPRLHEGWTYRCEYLAKPKHNVLAYDRTPENHLIIFDINTGHEAYLEYDEMVKEACDIGLEVVPLVYRGKIVDLDTFVKLIERKSILGGVDIEGVVAKNYHRYGRDGKALMGKFVSTKFKEVHNKDWKEKNPQGIDIVTKIGTMHRSEARFAKALQHLQEDGIAIGELRDIGKLIPEVKRDIKDECADDIKEILFKWAWPKIERMVTAGLPDWYKKHLLESTFIETED